MSIQAVAWVLEHSKATLATRLVLIAIANHCDARGWNAWPAQSLIAAEAGVDERSVRRAVGTLEELGELSVNRRPGRPSIYGIPAMHPGHPVRGDPGHPVRSPRTSCPPTPDRMSDEPLKNRPNINARASGATAATNETAKDPNRKPIWSGVPLSQDEKGNWFVGSQPEAAPEAAPRPGLPPPLPDAEFMRNLRRGTNP